MPASYRKLPKGGYKVSTPKGVKAKHTTFKKAIAQVKFLNAIEHGWKPGKVK